MGKRKKEIFSFPWENKTATAGLFVRKNNTKKASFKGPSQLFQKQRLTKAQCGELDRHQELQRGHATTSCAFVSAALSSSSLKECGPGAQRVVHSAPPPRPTPQPFLLPHTLPAVTHCAVFYIYLHSDLLTFRNSNTILSLHFSHARTFPE